ncbi:BRO family protein [Tepidibacillus decaturensis]|uniref:Bro-N domain-containing protein n=1 Tax=Tepidibacillus decaturensis TaxID=1413211 RepID=A0A135L1J3_9BACI|nr:phage antirepressor [Tepidibacillus decaturensis]KXG42855.1 hypothetical protein U473_01535 [Tepidibacillus decaturensis]
MNQLQQVFNYQNHQVRTVIINDEPWFVAKDVCDVLNHSNHKVAVSRLDEDEVSKVYLTDSLGREQNTTIVNESGLYALIMTSNKHEAKQFKRWITHEVIPSIRKTGSYSIQKYQLPQTFSEALRLLADEVEARERLEQQLKITAPKAEMFDVIASADNAQTMSAVAKSFNWGRNKMFAFLREQKVLRHNNEPYQEYIDRGYFSVRQVPIVRSNRTDNKVQTLVTAKGIEFIGRLLQKQGLLQQAK